jgi:hypothetical protein
MKRISNLKLVPILMVGLGLSACATGDYMSQLSSPNFGKRVLPSVDLDPAALSYGMYAPKFSQTPCLAADYRCSPQTQLLWAESAPR